jgi:uncharacterized protein (DUF362 family)
MMKRRDFLRTTAGAAAGALILPNTGLLAALPDTAPDLVVVEKGSPGEMVRKAVEALGGIKRFVTSGDIVVIKPNMSWDRVPQQAATTDPQVVAEMVHLCFEAGAKKVKVFDRTLNEASRCYKRSGIEKAARDAGADVHHPYERRYKNVRFPEGELVKSWKLYSEVLEADCIINLPIAKHHTISHVSLGMKNFMGYLGGERGKFHRGFDVKIVDLNTRLKADLTLLDANRMLVRNGPSGGNLADVVQKQMVVAGTNVVSVDSFGATLFDKKPEMIGFLKNAKERGLGEIDLSKLTIQRISLA